MAKRDDKKKIYTTDVLVKLDDGGARALLRESVKLDARADELEDKLSEHKKAESAKIAGIRAEAVRKRHGADAGEFMAPMKVYEVWEGPHAFLYSADTDEQVGQRALTAEERQTDAFPGIDDGGALDADEGQTFTPADPPGAASKKRGKKS